jgi:glycosyltransferase involved in cell wall biosynthesis
MTATSRVSVPAATRQLRVVLVNATLGAQGGVTIDVENIARGLRMEGHVPVVTTTMRSVTNALRDERSSLLHVFGLLPVPTEWTAVVAAKATGRKVVWTPVFHQSRQGSWPERRQNWKMFLPFRAMQAFDTVMPRAARFVDAVIAATESEAAFFRRIGAKRAEVIPPGVPALGRRSTPDEAARFRSRFGLSDGPVVLIVSRDDSRKGLDFGLSAFRRLRDRMAQAQLLVLGPPADHPGSRQEGVTFPGWVGPEDVESAYGSAVTLFVPSLYEGLPRAVVEAWAFGLPVVASDRIPLASQIQGLTGRTVPYNDLERAADAMAQVIDAPNLAAEYGANGRRLVEKGFLLDRVVGRTIDLYAELTGGSIG